MSVGLVRLDACEVRLCDPCARVRARVSLVCPGSPRCLFTGTVLYTDAPSGLQEP